MSLVELLRYDPAKLIDIRGVGGLIIAPYNIHATGAIYEPQVIPGWELHDTGDLPDFSREDWVKVTGAEKINGKPIATPLSLEAAAKEAVMILQLDWQVI